MSPTCTSGLGIPTLATIEMSLYLGSTGFLPLGVGLAGGCEAVSALRSLPFSPLPAKGG